MLTDPLFYALAIPCFLLIGISKGGFGSGLGSLAAPVMALAVPIPQVAAIQLPILIAMDCFGLWAYRGKWHRPSLPVIFTGAAIGLVLGYLTFRYLSEIWLRLLIGLVAVGYPLSEFWRARTPHLPRAAPSTASGIAWSALAGHVSFIANAGGPPIAVHLLRTGLDKTAYVATTAAFFAVINWVKVPAYWALGQFTDQNLLTAAVLMPMAPVGMLLGIWLHHRIPARPFFLVCNVLLAIVGLYLLITSAGAAIGPLRSQG